MAKLILSLKYAQRLCVVALLTVALWLTNLSTTYAYIVPDWVGENVLDPLFLEITRTPGSDQRGRFGTCIEDETATESFGVVISQDPTAGSDVTCDALACLVEGPVIDVVISAKPPIPDVNVPDLIGKSVTPDNIPDLPEFDCPNVVVLGSVIQDENAQAPWGTITSQTPSAATSVPWGTAVDVTVSIAATVPNVVDKTLSQAETILSAANLVLGTITENSSVCAPDSIIFDQTPNAGEFVPAGITVDIAVSTNPNGHLEVPDVVGLPYWNVFVEFASAGFPTRGEVIVVPSESIPSRHVATQEPAAGTCDSDWLTPINIGVSSGLAPGGSPLFIDDFSGSTTDRWSK